MLQMRAPGPTDLGARVVFWVDMLLLCVLGISVVLVAPRAIARLRDPRSRNRGHFLCMQLLQILMPMNH